MSCCIVGKQNDIQRQEAKYWTSCSKTGSNYKILFTFATVCQV